jgi:hypothetical protein
MRERESDRERGRKRERTKRKFLARDKVEFNDRGNRQYKCLTPVQSRQAYRSKVI